MADFHDDLKAAKDKDPVLKDIIQQGVASGFLMSDAEFTKLLNYFGLVTRHIFNGEDDVPPAFFIALYRSEEEIQKLKAEYCEEAGLTVTELEEGIAAANGAFLPIAAYYLDKEQMENRFEYLHELGRDFKDKPQCAFFVAGTWTSIPPDDKDEWDEWDYKLSRGEIRPSDHPRRTEHLSIFAQCVDGRGAMKMFPIDRDPEGKMIIGPEDERFKEAKGAVSPLVREFWMGYSKGILDRLGFNPDDVKSIEEFQAKYRASQKDSNG